MAILTTGNSYSDGNQITSSNLNAVVNSATFDDPVDTASGLNLTADSPPKIAINTSLSNKILTGGSLNNCPIGAVTPSTGAFTTLSASSGYTGNVTGNLTGNVTGGTGSFTTLAASGDVTFDTTTLKVDSTNNRVGIGTASPAVALDVVGAGTITAGLNVGIEDDTPGLVNILGGGATEEGGELRIYNPSDYDGSYDFWRLDSDVNGFFRIGRTGQTDLSIDHDGYVGIGTTNADKALVVAGAGAEIVIDDTDTTDTPRLRFRESGATSGGVSTDAGELIFDTGTTERVRIDSSGNVGINTNNPTELLHVKSSNSDTAETVAGFGNGDIDVGLQIKTNGNGGSSLDWGFNAVNSRHLVFDTNQTERMRITSTGNVGIGTTSPDELLHIKGGSDRPLVVESTDAFCFISLNDNSTSAQSAVMIGAQGDDLRIDAGDSERIRVESNGNVGIGDSTPSYKLDVNGTFRTTDDIYNNISGTQSALPGYYKGTYGAQIESTATGSTFHIARSGGNCMNIGADATAAGTDVNVVYFRDTGAGSTVATEVGKIIIDTTSTNYATSSDYRLKENEVDITDGIDRLKELKPYRFNFTRNPSKVVDGFFAHEVSPVVPESISGEKDQVDDEGNPVYQGIDQSKLVPLLTAALQEAVAKIEALEARVQTLEG